MNPLMRLATWPFRAMNQISDLIMRRLRHLPKSTAIVLMPSGFRIDAMFDNGKVEQGSSIEWQQIHRAVVFKRDLYTVDRISLALETADSTLELHEEMQGWQLFIESLPQHLPGCQPFEQWFLKVAFPAFEANPTEIYRRDASDQNLNPADIG